MSDHSTPLDAREFARHAQFVRRLARRLANDEAAAEDLAQEAWLAAVERPPTSKQRMRSWLAAVVRNKSVQRTRSDVRRRAREESRFDDESADDTAELVERMELHQRVVRAVLESPEPYRAVLLRRFSRGEEAAVIARQLELPEATVRTRLRRGLEKLRERLRGEMGGSPALFFASLCRLADEPPFVTHPMGPPPASATQVFPLIAALVMKKTVLVTLLFLAALAVVWSTSAGAGADARPAAREEGVRAPADLRRVASSELAAATLEPPAETSKRAEVVVESTEAQPPVEFSAPESVALVGEVAIRIEDVYGNPISQAQLHATQWRSLENPGSSVWWGADDERYMGESGRDGVVRLLYTKKHSSTSEGPRTVGSVGFEVTHPDYITHEEYDLDVADGESVVVLRRGSFLIVSGWVESPTERLVDVRPHLTFDVDVDAADWIPVRDGRPSCSRIPPGQHGIYLSRTDETGRSWASDVVPFELVEGEQKELALQLHPPRMLVGLLDERVPRPVTNGEVELNLYVTGKAKGDVMLRPYRADVAADGRFTFEGLPPGAGEIIAICDGWASARTRLADSNWIEPENEGGERRWQRMWQLQQLDPAEHAEDPYVVAMEPTGHVRLTVLDPDGAPIQGARLACWPNVHWELGYSNFFLGRTWSTTTNAYGVALLENLPALSGVGIGVACEEGFMMPRKRAGDDASRGVSADVRSGETVEVTVQMDPAPADGAG